MALSSNYFEMFGLPVSFTVDMSRLAERYLELQRQFHPDRFADKPVQEQRLAVQYTADINQANSTLRSPLMRAQYLLSLVGVDSSGDSTVTSDMGFLMQQMALREALAEVSDAADPFAELESIAEQTQKHFSELQNEFADLYGKSDYNSAVDSVAKLQFYSKLLSEIEQREQDLDEL